MILTVASLVAFSTWVYTLGAWQAELRYANGAKPLVSTMLIVGAILTIMAIAMLSVVFVEPTFSTVNMAAALLYRVCLVAVCVAMFRFRHLLRQIDISHNGDKGEPVKTETPVSPVSIQVNQEVSNHGGL